MMLGFVALGKQQHQPVGSKLFWMARGTGMADPPESGNLAQEGLVELSRLGDSFKGRQS